MKFGLKKELAAALSLFCSMHAFAQTNPPNVWDVQTSYTPGAAPTPAAPWEAHQSNGTGCATEAGLLSLAWPNPPVAGVFTGVVASTQVYPGNYQPLVYKNTSGTAVASTELKIYPNQVALHPGITCAVLRFTAPYAGMYTVSGEFFAPEPVGQPIHPWHVGTHVLVKNIPIASGVVDKPAGIQGWSIPAAAPFPLQQGETIAFALDNGGNGFNADTTLLTARITRVDVLPNTGFIAKDFDFEGMQGCAIEDGTLKLYCWGSDNARQLGTTTAGNSNKAVMAQRIQNYLTAHSYGPVFDVQVGTSTVCAKTMTANTLCWGSNNSRQSGMASGSTTLGTNAPYHLNNLTAQLGTYQPLKLDGNTACIVDPAAKLRCWGANNINNFSYGGQLGWKNGTFAASDQPMPPVPNVSDVLMAAPGGTSTCAIVGPLKKVMCWSNTPWGPGVILGGGPSPTLLPHPDGIAQTYVKTSASTELTGATKILVSYSGGFACALASNSLYCWGLNATYGSIEGAPVNGAGSPANVLSYAKAMPGPFSGGVSDFAIGSLAICAVAGPGSQVFCQGSATNGQLGKAPLSGWRTFTAAYASATVVHDLTPIPGLAGVTKIRGGSGTFCAMKNAGEIWCWGAGSLGQLGHGTTVTNSITPVRVIK